MRLYVDDDLPQPVSGPEVVCERCGTVLPPSVRFCDKCGTAIEDPDDRIAYDALHGPALRKARNWILAVGGLYLIGGLIFFAILAGSDQALPVLGLNVVLALIHVGLWWWAARAPFAAAVAALALFITVHLVDAIADPSSLCRGLIIKAFFLGALIGAVRAGLAARRLRLRH
jgi:hypothetical protein